MATVANLIDRSLRLLEAIESGANATDEEYADGLVALVDMLDEWQLEPGLIYAIRDESITLTSSTQSYAIGPSGVLVTTRPPEIEAAYILKSGSSYPVRLISEIEYAQIVQKTTTASWPSYAYYQPSMPNGTLYVYPEATDTAAVLHILTRTPLTVFTAITDTISLPPGYRKAIASNLALELAPEFGVEVPQAVLKMATESRANIKRQNARPSPLNTGLVGILSGGRSNIITNN